MKGCVIPLDDNGIVHIGKDVNHVNIVIPRSYAKVSRIHCSIKYSSEFKKFFVTDCSSNGTLYQTGEKLIKGKRTAVANDTIIYLADEECAILLKATDLATT